MDTLNNTPLPEMFELSGRARIRAMFHPRQRVGLIAAGKVLGLSYPQLNRRIHQGKLDLRIHRDEYGQMYVLVDDLAAYLFPSDNDSSQFPLPSFPSVSTKRPGRPRRSVISDGQKGGAR